MQVGFPWTAFRNLCDTLKHDRSVSPIIVSRITNAEPTIHPRMPSTNKRKPPQSIDSPASKTSPDSSKPLSNGFTYAEGTHVSKKRRVGANGAEKTVVSEQVDEMTTAEDGEAGTAEVDVKPSGGLFGNGSAPTSGNPFSGLASSSGMEDGGFEKVMSKDEKRKDKKRKREEKLKLVSLFHPLYFAFTDEVFARSISRNSSLIRMGSRNTRSG